MSGKLSYTLIDYGGEKSTVKLSMPEVSDINYSTAETQIDALISAIDGITLMAPVQDTRTYVVNDYAGTLPTSQYAQREHKWLVQFHDSAGNRGTLEVPGADLTLLNTNEDTMNIDSGAGATFVTALEALLLNTYGNAITVDRVVHVGRNI